MKNLVYVSIFCLSCAFSFSAAAQEDDLEYYEDAGEEATLSVNGGEKLALDSEEARARIEKIKEEVSRQIKANSDNQFIAIDTNKDNVISQEEFIAYRVELLKETIIKNFNQFDLNKDGVVSKEEYEQSMSPYHQMMNDKIMNSLQQSFE